MPPRHRGPARGEEMNDAPLASLAINRVLRVILV